jgi:cell division protein FtsZ
MGIALMGTGQASGDDRALQAAKRAIENPLLEDISIDGARGVLINITASSDFTIDEVSEASTFIQEAAHEDANIIWGTVIDDTLGEEMRVTVIATGIGAKQQEQAMPVPRVVNGGGGVSAASTGSDPFNVDHTNFKFYERDKGAGKPAPQRGRRGLLAGGGQDLEVPTFLRRQAD